MITTESLAVVAAADFGPRIVSLVPTGGPNLFADLGDLGIGIPGGGRYVFRGGHRLWTAPEVPETTYEPDHIPVSWRVDDRHLTIHSPNTGIGKTIEILAGGDGVVVTHTVTNHTDDAVELAPWAITQLRPGGTALLPLHDAPLDRYELQANSTVVGWPYTDWGALEYDLSAHVVHLAADRQMPTKIGTSLDRGWLGYVNDGWLFTKYARRGPISPVDRGAQAEIYISADFVELETLGSLVRLEPGESTVHDEAWQVAPAPDSVAGIARLAESRDPWKEPR